MSFKYDRFIKYNIVFDLLNIFVYSIDMARSRFNFNFKKNKKLFMFLGVALALMLIVVFLIKRSRENFQDNVNGSTPPRSPNIPKIIEYSCIPIEINEFRKIKSDLESEKQRIDSLLDYKQTEGWLSKYYQFDNELNNFPEKSLLNNKKPNFVRIEPQLMFKSEYSQESGYNIFNNLVLKENFMSTHVTIFSPTITGEYTFALNSDDGSTLFINDKKIIEIQRVGPMDDSSEVQQTMSLNQGTKYTIEVNYFQKIGHADLKVTFKPPNSINSDESFIPLVGISPDPNIGGEFSEIFSKRKEAINEMLNEANSCDLRDTRVGYNEYEEYLKYLTNDCGNWSINENHVINLTLKNIIKPTKNILEYYDKINSDVSRSWGRDDISNELTLASFYKPPRRSEPYAYKFNNITIPNTIKIIGENAFSRYILKTVSFESSSKLETIEEYAFRLSTLEKIIIPESVTTIGRGAFAVTNLKKIVIPKNVKSIGLGAFLNTTLTNVYIYSELYNSLIENDSKKIYNYFSNRNNNHIYVSVKNNDNGKTIKNFKLTVLPNTLLFDMHGARIKFEAHAKNVPLIPDELYKSLKISFNSIDTLEIPNGITQIDDYAFYNTNIRKIIIPESVTKIGDHAFYTRKLEEVVFKDVDYFNKLKDKIYDESLLDYKDQYFVAEGVDRTLLNDIKKTPNFNGLKKLHIIFGKMTLIKKQKISIFYPVSEQATIKYPDLKTGYKRTQYRYSLPVFKNINNVLLTTEPSDLNTEPNTVPHSLPFSDLPNMPPTEPLNEPPNMPSTTPSMMLPSETSNLPPNMPSTMPSMMLPSETSNLPPTMPSTTPSMMLPSETTGLGPNEKWLNTPNANLIKIRGWYGVKLPDINDSNLKLVKILIGINSIEDCEKYFMYEPEGQAADGFTYFPKNGICRLFQLSGNIIFEMKSFQDSDTVMKKIINNSQYFRKFDSPVYTVFRKEFTHVF
jgi:hypothetical protein